MRQNRSSNMGQAGASPLSANNQSTDNRAAFDFVEVQIKTENPSKHYKIEKKINATSYSAKEKSTGNLYQIKSVLKKSLEKNQKERQRFDFELRAHKNLISPYITRFVDAYMHGTTFFLVTELIGSDGSIADVIQIASRNGQTLSLEFCLYVLYNVANAIKALHDRDLIHRNIIPSIFHCNKEGDIKMADLSFTLQIFGETAPSQEFAGCAERAPHEVVNQ